MGLEAGVAVCTTPLERLLRWDVCSVVSRMVSLMSCALQIEGPLRGLLAQSILDASQAGLTSKEIRKVSPTFLLLPIFDGA